MLSLIDDAAEAAEFYPVLPAPDAKAKVKSSPLLTDDADELEEHASIA